MITSGCASPRARVEVVDEAVSKGDREEKWNEASIHAWVAGLAEPNDRFSHLDTVQSFERLQSSIEEVKEMVLADSENEQEAIEGLRMILKHLAVSTLDTLNADYQNPLFAKGDSRVRDIGAYNPDAEYDQAFIDGRYDYKLTGNLGTAPYVSITVNGQSEGKFSEIIAFVDDAAIREHAAPDGSYVLWLTKERPNAAGGWVKLPDSANGVVIRQYIGDRTRTELARFSIEAVGNSLPNVESVSDAEIALRMDTAADYLAVSSTWHRTLLPTIRERPNHFVPSTGSAIGASAANRANYYQIAYYELREGESLVIDFEPPEGIEYWNLTSATFWHESHRYRTDPVSLTSSEVEYRHDGRVRFILSRSDPGGANWIKTFSHDRGFLIFRMPGVETHPVPSVQRVPNERLPALLQRQSAAM